MTKSMTITEKLDEIEELADDIDYANANDINWDIRKKASDIRRLVEELRKEITKDNQSE